MVPPQPMFSFASLAVQLGAGTGAHPFKIQGYDDCRRGRMLPAISTLLSRTCVMA